MLPICFVAIADDNQTLILRDEVGRIHALPIDERLLAAIHHGPERDSTSVTEGDYSLTPREIQGRIRRGDTVDEVARTANLPVDKVMRFAGPVLQERAAIAQDSRRAKVRAAGSANNLAEIVEAGLRSHGVDSDSATWDSYRQDDGTWRIMISWFSEQGTLSVHWNLDRARSTAQPADDMAHYFCEPRFLGQPHSLPHQSTPTTPPLVSSTAATQVLGTLDSARARARSESSHKEEPETSTVTPLKVPRQSVSLHPEPTPAPIARAAAPSWEDILLGSDRGQH